MKKYALILNSQCNEKCNYCHTLLENKPFNVDKLSFLDSIDLTEREILLVGGEPGILTLNEIDQVYNKIYLSKKISVQTNGLFIKKFFNIYSDKMQFIYHLISTKHEIFLHENISYYVVIDEFNIDEMFNFFNERRDIEFTVTISWKQQQFSDEFKNKILKLFCLQNVRLDNYDKEIFIKNINSIIILKNILKEKCVHDHEFIKLY